MAGSGPKLAHDIMLSSGMLSYFAMGDLVNIAKGSVDIAGQGMDSAWNKSDSMGRDTGEGIGEVINSTGMFMANLGLMGHTASIYGKSKVWLGMGMGNRTVTEAQSVMAKNGVAHIWNKMEEGGFQKAGTIKQGQFTPFAGTSNIVAEESALGKVLGTKRFSTGGSLVKTGPGVGKFVANQGLIRGFAPFAAAMAIGYGAKSILGFAGGLVDEAVRDHHRERSVHYDNRFFNTERDEMSNMQTLGAAMNNYENRFQSTARIYHSR